MKLRFNIPLRIDLIARDEADLAVSTSFEYQNHAVSVAISPTSVLSYETSDKTKEYWLFVESCG